MLNDLCRNCKLLPVAFVVPTARAWPPLPVDHGPERTATVMKQSTNTLGQ